MTAIGSDWRVVEGVVTTWFDAPSLSAAAALGTYITGLAPSAAIDLRSAGVRVRLDAAEQTGDVSAAAQELGLVADPGVLQQLSVVVESADPAALSRFWQDALGYEAAATGDLVDPLRRDPALSLRQSADARPLRNRIHLDVVRPAAVVEQAGLGEAFGAYGVCHADADGNEVDVVPGDPLGETDATSDWQAVFGAVASYRTTSPAAQGALAVALAALADEAGFPLLIDLPPGLVVLDSGKDRWEADAHGLDLDFVELAARLQRAAREAGATADATLPRFVQLFMDAADVAAVRAFWAAALGYEPDRREGVTDLNDPRRLNPVLVFQELDSAEVERRRQRNRMHLELAVPADAARTRVETALTAGGRLLGEAADRWLIVDPEDNELVVKTAR